MAFSNEEIQKALKAGELAQQFASYVEVLGQMIDNHMMKENERFKECPSNIYSDAYYSTIYYCGDSEVKAKAVALLGIDNEEWFPEKDKEAALKERDKKT